MKVYKLTKEQREFLKNDTGEVFPYYKLNIKVILDKGQYTAVQKEAINIAIIRYKKK